MSEARKFNMWNTGVMWMMMTISIFCYLAWLSSAVRMIPLYPCNQPGTLYVSRKYRLHAYITPSISVSKFISSVILTVSQVISVLLFCGQLFKHLYTEVCQKIKQNLHKVHWTIKVKPKIIYPLCSTEFRSCVKVEAAVLGSSSLISLMVSVEVKQHFGRRRYWLEIMSAN